MDQVISTAQTDAIIPEVWSARQYEVLLNELPFSAVIANDYEGEIRDLGDTVHIHSIPEFSDAVEIDELAKNDADAATISDQTLLVNKRVAKDFIITKKALLQSLPFMDGVREKAVYAIMKKMENTIISSIVPSAAAPDHTIAYSVGSTLALADLLNGKELLDTQNVPTGDRHMVVGAAQLNDIFNITGFTSSDFVLSGGVLQNGKVPEALLGFLPHFTNLVGQVTHLFHRSFMTIAVQQSLGIEVFNLGVDGTRASRVNCDLLYGLKQLDGKRCVTIS
jgi:hypothetical protein